MLLCYRVIVLSRVVAYVVLSFKFHARLARHPTRSYRETTLVFGDTFSDYIGTLLENNSLQREGCVNVKFVFTRAKRDTNGILPLSMLI